MNLQESAEMYLETILVLQKENGQVRAIDIARHMQFARPTVSQALNALPKMAIWNWTLTSTFPSPPKASKSLPRPTAVTTAWQRFLSGWG